MPCFTYCIYYIVQDTLPESHVKGDSIPSGRTSTMNKHAKQLAAIAELFGQVLYRVPQENRRLALALFKAAMAVVLDGSDEIGSEFSKRALAWNSDRKARTDQTADDMQT